MNSSRHLQHEQPIPLDEALPGPGADRMVDGVPVKTYRGASLAQLAPQIRADFGDRAMIVRQREGVTGGFAGFFAKRCIEVDVAAMPSSVARPGSTRSTVLPRRRCAARASRRLRLRLPQRLPPSRRSPPRHLSRRRPPHRSLRCPTRASRSTLLRLPLLSSRVLRPHCVPSVSVPSASSSPAARLRRPSCRLIQVRAA